MIKVLFVCLGNICRSPMAQALFENELKKLSLNDKIISDSCGTGHWHVGEPPDERALEILSANNIEFEHLGRALSVKDFTAFHYILGMDQQNMRDINKIKPKHSTAKIFLFRDFDNASADINVPDPYWGGNDGFKNVFNIIERTNKTFLNFIIKEHKLN